MLELDKPQWEVEGRRWPLRAWSSFHRAGGLDWHVQTGGSGPVCLLLHGTGAATHSWRTLAPLLAAQFTVVAPDLPGHGFTATPERTPLTLGTMARLVGALVQALDVKPALVVAHSAGAAIALRMALDGRIEPAGIVSLNGALRPFRGSAGPLFSAMAKTLFLNPLAPRLFALAARDRRRVARLLENTGSPLDAEGVALYQLLFRSSSHIAGTLGMMANWDLAGLTRDLPRLAPRLLLVAAGGDRAVPPSDAGLIARMVPGARVVTLPRLGHLAHEEDPAQVAAIVTQFATELGLVPEACS